MGETLHAEPVTFAGIPIPLTMETLLDAMEKANQKSLEYFIDFDPEFAKAVRQYHAFCARIIRMFRKRDSQASKSFYLWTTERGITNDLRRQLAVKDKTIQAKQESEVSLSKMVASRDEQLVAKDARIAELEEQIEDILAEAKWHVG
jgi:hypothetical protein